MKASIRSGCFSKLEICPPLLSLLIGNLSFLLKLVLAHVTNKLAAYVTDLTVQVFKEDWSRTGGSMNSVLMRPQWSLNPLDHTPRVLSHGITPAS